MKGIMEKARRVNKRPFKIRGSGKTGMVVGVHEGTGLKPGDMVFQSVTPEGLVVLELDRSGKN